MASYTIKNMWVSPSKYNIKSPYAMNPTTITIHETDNNAHPENEANYMRNNNMYTSWHAAFGDKLVVQTLPFNRNGWAAGDGANGPGNRTSIHFEICYNKDNGYNGPMSARMIKAIDNCALYTAHVLIQFGWGTDRLRRHWDWTRKHCPRKIIQENKWNGFKRQVQSYMDEIRGVKKPANTTKYKTGGAGNIKYDGDWRFNSNTQVYWVPVEAEYTLAYDTYAYDKLPKIIRKNRLNQIKAGTTIKVVELCRYVEPSGDSFVWAVYRTGKGRLRYLPIKKWNKRPGRVTNSGLWGYFSKPKK